jgi:hypothetical protein
MNCEIFLKLAEEWIGDVCIFGAGKFGCGSGYELIREAGFRVAFYCDNKCTDKEKNGYPVYPASYLLDKADKVLCIVCVFGKPGEEILDQLNMMGLKHFFHLAVGDVEWELAQYLDELGDSTLIKRFPYIMDDEIYLKRRYRIRTGKELHLDHPITFNEKLQWMKLYNRNPIFTIMADKYAVKQYVSDLIGSEYIIPTLGIWNSFDEIDFDTLPNSFVLKCTHDSGSVIICKNKEEFDVKKARDKIESARKKNYYWPDREWPYKNIPRRIIAEEYLESESDVLEVYKVFNFEGHPAIIQAVQNDKTKNETIDYYDTEWNLLELRQNYPNSIEHINKPKQLDELLLLAERLAKGLASIRTDFYINNDRIFFSEYTFFSDSGCEPFHPEEWDEKLGRLFTLNENYAVM